VNPFHFSFF